MVDYRAFIAEQALRRNPGLKVIFNSGYGEHELASKWGVSGSTIALLQKAYLFEDLKITLQGALGGAAGNDSLAKILPFSID